MKTFRLKIRPHSSFLTPWQADTIFGSLCWILSWREGTDALTQFLQEYKNGNPVFVLSDGFPGDLLPAPLHMSLRKSKGDSIEEYKRAKELKKVSWFSPEVFESVLRGAMEIGVADVSKAIKTYTTLHSSINRITGTTGDEGSLFELEEYAIESRELMADTLSIYIKIKDGWEEKVESLFKDLSLIGYGKKRSIGKGSFEIAGALEPYNKFDNFGEANGFVTLSNFVPSKDDPIEGFYKTMVKYGKLGGEYTFNGNPFKKPIIMLTAGSVFYTRESIRPFYGRMVEGVSPAKPEVVHYGYAFSVPVKIDI